MISGVHIESLVVAGYAALLVLIAESLELAARFALRRADQYHTAGFTYHRGLDVWECPQGERLRRQETDHLRRVIRYHAPAHACNQCPVKPLCTDSDSGRELEHRPESWFESEIGQFHRGISLALLFLAGLILALEMARHGQPQDLLLLGGLLISIALLGMRLMSAFWGRAAGAQERPLATITKAAIVRVALPSQDAPSPLERQRLRDTTGNPPVGQQVRQHKRCGGEKNASSLSHGRGTEPDTEHQPSDPQIA